MNGDVNMGRVWTIGAEFLQPDEKGRGASVVGILLTGSQPTGGFVRAMRDGHRDVAFFVETRLLVVQPKPPQKIGLIGAFRAARGDPSKIADSLTVPRADVRAIRELTSPPAGLRLLADDPMKFLDITVARRGGERTLQLWVDEANTDAGRYRDVVLRYACQGRRHP